ncbi:Beta-glucosidase [Cystobacter fuscus DSM 2262]|uniref:Beta-glucosidase n=1 Tax=Cystobacter fuscus (strain ATCC 25194 / DSM 2262 / NBRC 100088 / M29) TaxID=1242864 RepID=S9NYD8_CYSF2|nr:glycoside hydrolase family 1 protein [Cystobacter fuscus]EPX55032.1 Beta-glucosidase [Cystobacter fuscus DSM 2262]
MSRRALLLGLSLLAGCTGRPSFDPATINAAPIGQGLPRGFLLGASTASHQVEGNNQNDWTDWETSSYPDGSPHIHDRSVSGIAADSWNRFDEDIALLKKLGANAYRFSVEWSRLEPEKGQWNTEAFERYRQWVRALRANGIEPNVTLHHFTLPRWVSAKGGWENPTTVEDFASFSGKVAEELGEQVDWWGTINEPNVYAVFGYMDGVWPPGKQSTGIAAEVLARLLEAHARSAQQVRENDTWDADGDGKNSLIGLVHHVRVFQPATGSTTDTVVTGLTDSFFNQSVTEALRTGHISILVPGEISIERDVPGLKGSADYLGINYYTRDHVRQDFSPSFSHKYVPEDRETNDLGWEIYPEGLYMFLKRYANLGMPLVVTENGMDDRTGERRPYFLRSHLYAVERAVAEGVPVRGYFHWSLMDNFEWAEGYEPRFGLFRVDWTGGRDRQVTPAVEAFRDVARNLGLTPTP